MGFQYIPAELKGRCQWVVHRFPNKMPLCARSLRPASCNDRGTWSSFEAAVATVEAGKASGVGIQLADGICGVDIDHCIDGGELSSMAKEIVATLHSYTEVSPSGEGIHILCKGHLPAREGNRDSLLGLEMYDSGRYFTVTGNAWTDEDGLQYPLRDCTTELDRIHQKYISPKPPEQTQLGRPPKAVAQKPVTPVESPQAVRDLSDQQLLELAFRSKNGARIRRLYEGSYSGQDVAARADGSPDQSAADLALVGHLAFWLGGDTARIDRVFRQSALYRKKWDEKRGRFSYGQRTIQRALRGMTDFFVPYERSMQGQREPPPLPEPPPERKRAATETEELLEPFEPESEPPVPMEPRKYTLDDTGNAYRFRDRYQRDLRFDFTAKSWLYWTGIRWEPDLSGEVKRRANQLLEEMAEQASDQDDASLLRHVRKTRASKYKEAMLREAQPLAGIPILQGRLDTWPALLNVKNGVVNLKSGVLEPHKRELYLSMLAPAQYQSDAACPRWMRFLDEITQGDTELQLYLQRMAGYALTGATSEQCAFFLYGRGGNGKSVFMDTVKTLLGDYAKTCDPEVLMVKERGSGVNAASELARMKGVRLITTTEPDNGCRIAEGRLKRITGQDTITARRMYEMSFEYKPEFKVWMATNVKPVIIGTDEGIWRRVKLVPFTACIPPERVDLRLAEKLRSEAAGILAWMVQGAADWYREGLPACQRVDTAVQDYRSEMDKLGEFVQDCLVPVQGNALQSSQIYSAYQAWCAQNGERYPISNRKLSMELQDRFGFLKRKNRAFAEFQNIDFTAAGVQYVHAEK